MKIHKLAFACITALITAMGGVEAAPIVYIPFGSGNQIIPVDAATDRITAAFRGVDNPHGLDIGDDGKTLFISSKAGGKLTALGTDTGKVCREINLVSAPYHLNTIHGTGKSYVSSRAEPKIWVVDQKTLAVTGEIALPAGEGHQMAIVR